jgi:hypothetical protein
MCYLHNSNASQFSTSESFCSRRGGNLVKYDSGAAQLMVRSCLW